MTDRTPRRTYTFDEVLTMFGLTRADLKDELVRVCDCATPGNCDGCHCWRPEPSA